MGWSARCACTCVPSPTSACAPPSASSRWHHRHRHRHRFHALAPRRCSQGSSRSRTCRASRLVPTLRRRRPTRRRTVVSTRPSKPSRCTCSTASPKTTSSYASCWATCATASTPTDVGCGNATRFAAATSSPRTCLRRRRLGMRPSAASPSPNARRSARRSTTRRSARARRSRSPGRPPTHATSPCASATCSRRLAAARRARSPAPSSYDAIPTGAPSPLRTTIRCACSWRAHAPTCGCWTLVRRPRHVTRARDDPRLRGPRRCSRPSACWATRARGASARSGPTSPARVARSCGRDWTASRWPFNRARSGACSSRPSTRRSTGSCTPS